MKDFSTLSRNVSLTWPRNVGLGKRQRAKYRELVVETKHKKIRQHKLLEKLQLPASQGPPKLPYRNKNSLMERITNKITTIKNRTNYDNKSKKCLNCLLQHPKRSRDICSAYGFMYLNRGIKLIICVRSSKLIIPLK